MKIINRWTSAFIYEDQAETMRETVWNAVRALVSLRGADLSGADLSEANLSGANLSGANLSSADLSGANLSGANLSGANLSSADLSEANLSGADLSGADLSGANLSGADLIGANLSGANLSGADLSGADLSEANLSGANLSGANLRPIKADIWYVLTLNQAEVPDLRAALVDGKINGSQYSGECACLVGTIANVRGCHYDELVSDPDSAAERWFLGILPGHTPENSQIAAITMEWIDEWLALHGVVIQSATTKEVMPTSR